MVKKVNVVSDCYSVNAIDTSDLVKKADCITKIVEIEEKILDHNKYVTIPRFNKLTTKDNFAKRLKQTNSVSKNNIAEFVKKRDFNEKVRKISNKVTNDKTKYVEAEKKLDDHITSYTKLVIDLSGKVKLMSTNGSKIDLLNRYSILNSATHFVEDGSQN